MIYVNISVKIKLSSIFLAFESYPYNLDVPVNFEFL